MRQLDRIIDKNSSFPQWRKKQKKRIRCEHALEDLESCVTKSSMWTMRQKREIDPENKF